MENRSKQATLEHLSEGIERFDGKNPPEASRQSADMPGGDTAMRMGLELVFSVMGCAGAGLFLDHWLGTSPFLMVAGLFLGAGAGFWLLVHSPKR